MLIAKADEKLTYKAWKVQKIDPNFRPISTSAAKASNLKHLDFDLTELLFVPFNILLQSL